MHQQNYQTFLVAGFAYRLIMANPVLATYAPTDPNLWECLYPSFGNVFYINKDDYFCPPLYLTPRHVYAYYHLRVREYRDLVHHCYCECEYTSVICEFPTTVM